MHTPAYVPHEANQRPWGNIVAEYRVYLLNAADRIFDWRGIEHDTDAAAIAAAARLVRDYAVEIWTGKRRVARLSAEELESRRGRVSGDLDSASPADV
jgi:hypothetical protein